MKSPATGDVDCVANGGAHEGALAGDRDIVSGHVKRADEGAAAGIGYCGIVTVASRTDTNEGRISREAGLVVIGTTAHGHVAINDPGYLNVWVLNDFAAA